MVFSIATEWVGGRQLQTGLELKKFSIKIEREREREAEVFTQYLLCVSSVNGSILGCRECWDILEYLCKASVILNLLLYSSYDKFHGFFVMTGGFYYVFIHT